MKLELKNFRCHIDSKYILPDSGLTLISGKSGTGKSSLLKAISYIFFGKTRKPCSFNSTSCKVKLEWEYGEDKIIATRTTRPNVLKVDYNGTVFEDDSAQKLLEKLLGLTLQEFEIASYIAQKNGICIHSLSPQEQIKTIQVLSYDQEELNGLKDKLKGLTKKAEKDCEEYSTKLRFSIDELKSIKFVEDQDLENLSVEERDTIKEQLDKLPEAIKNKNIEKEKITKKNYTRKENVNKKKSLEKNKKEVGIELNSKKEYRDELREKILGNSKPEIEELQKQVEYLRLKERYDEELKSNQEENKKKRDEIENKLLDSKEFTEKSEKLRNLENLKKLTKNYGEIEKLEDEYSSLQDKLKNNYTSFKCPGCKKNLKLEDDKLVECEKKVKLENNKKYEKRWKELKNIIDKFEDCRDLDLEEYDSLKEIIDKNIEMKALLKHLEDYSVNLMNIEKKLENLKGYETDGDIGELTVELNSRKSNLILYNHTKSDIKKIETEIMSLSCKLEKIELELANIEISDEDFEKDLEKLNSSLEELYEKQEKLTEKNKIYEKWEKYIILQEKYKKWRDKVDNYEKRYRESEKSYNGFLRLKERYRQAEILAVESTINSINHHTQYYLDQFFRDDPLILNLEIIDAKKLEIVTKLKYKGYEYDNISQLSGGEFDRCVLASVCGVNTMMNSPFLFLDESLASLDAENNTEILGFLKELSEKKLVAVTSHEAITGIFDEIVEI